VLERKVLRVLLVDDHDMVRDALGMTLGLYDHIEVVGAARDGQEAVQLFSTLRPDIVLMDVVMPTVDGIEAARRICQQDPEARILALTSFEEKEKVIAAINAGMKGFILKTSAGDTLVDLMYRVFQGEHVFSREALELLGRSSAS
jgi:two-component system, NarL family, response regulator LiaR